MTVGSISVNIIAKTNKFAKQIKKATALMRGFERAVQTAALSVIALESAVRLLGMAWRSWPIQSFISAFKELSAVSEDTFAKTAKAMNAIANTNLSDNMVRGIQNAAKAVDNLQKKFKSFFVYLAAEFAPLVETIADKISGFMSSAPGGVQGIAKRVFEFILSVTKKIANGFQAVISAFLKVAASIYDLINRVRASKLMKRMGVSVTSEGDYRRAGQLRQAATNLERGGAWGDIITKGMAEAIDRSKIAQWDLGGVLRKIGQAPGAAITGGLAAAKGPLGQFLKSATLLYKSQRIEMTKAIPDQKALPKKGVTQGPLSALEAGTAEARRAQMGFSNTQLQDDTAQIKKYNKTQADAARATNKILEKVAREWAPFAIAGEF